MSKYRIKRICLFTVLTCILVLCVSIGIFLSVYAFGSNSGESNGGIARDPSTGQYKFTFGQTYTINGKQYTLGEAENECIDFYTALEVNSRDYDVTLTEFTYPDGTDGTESTKVVRNAGTYTFEIRSLANEWESEIATIDVGEGHIFIDVDSLPLLVNASTLKASNDGSEVYENDSYYSFPMHGNILTLYNCNDGWYMTKQAGLDFIESKTITNGYCYGQTVKTEDGQDTGVPADISIAFKGENLGASNLKNSTSSNYKLFNDLNVSNSTLNIEVLVNDGSSDLELSKWTKKTVTFNISNRRGVTGNISREYIASFTFSNSNYSINYGTTADEYKQVKMTDNGDNTFTVTKHWFIISESVAFFADAYMLPSNDEPYSPFGYGDRYSTLNTATGATDFAFDDNVTYLYQQDGNGLQVRIPRVSNETRVSASEKTPIYFSVDFIPYGAAQKYTLRAYNASGTNTALSVPSAKDEKVDYNNPNSLAYYFNEYMPAGTYTLTLYATKEGVAFYSDYTLVVKPAPFDSDKIEAIKQAFAAQSYDYSLGNTSVLYDHSKVDFSALNGDLNNARKGYWSSHSDYYDTNVTPAFNREGWNINGFDTESAVLDKISAPGTFTFYFSISARNYVTAGGADDAQYDEFCFITKLFTSVSDIYDELQKEDSVFFGDVEYTGSVAHTTVPTGRYFYAKWEYSDYTNVGRPYVTITLSDPEITGWEDVPQDLQDRVTKSEDGISLYVYYDITPATNSYTLPPSMSPWTYRAFDSDVNVIKATLAFPGAEIYYRLGMLSGSSYTWVDVGSSLTTGTELDSNGTNAATSWFTVDANGKVNDTVKEKLNALSAGTYVLASYVKARYDGEFLNVKAYTPTTDSYPSVYVYKANNYWTTTPSIFGWVYDSFDENIFIAGEDYFKDEGTVTYTLYKGTVSSGVKLFEGATGLTYTLPDPINKTVSEYFAELSAASYTLVATRAANGNNYDALTQQMPFSVTQATNSWVSGKTSSITGWVYGKFTSALVTSGEANFGNSDIKFTVQLDDNSGSSVSNFEGLSYNTLVGKLGTPETTLNVGSYILLVYVEKTDNYSRVEQSIRFAVSQAENEWNITPTITGWVYKEYNKKENNPMDASTVYPAGGDIEYKFYPATAGVGGSWNIAGKEIFESGFATQTAGTYIMIVTAPESTNYKGLSVTIPFTISKQTNEWINSESTPEGVLNWTWGEDKDWNELRLVKAAATDMSKGITYTIVDTSDNSTKPTITVKFENGEKNQDDISALIKALQDLEAGSYRITVTVNETDNYTERYEVTNVTVSKATFKWSDGVGPTDTEWYWGDLRSDKLEKLKAREPSATNVKGNTIKFTFSVRVEGGSSSTTNPDDFDALIKYLLGEEDSHGVDVGVYRITVSAALGKNLDGAGVEYNTDNYESFSKTFTVTIKKSTNSWTTPPQEEYEWEWENRNNYPITEAAAQFGSVVYYSDNSFQQALADSYDELVNWMRGRPADDNTPYVFYAVVKETLNYTGLDVSIQLIVTGTKSSWDSGATQESFSFTYAGEQDIKSKFTNGSEISQLIPVGVAHGSTKYTVTYAKHDGTGVVSDEKTSVSDIMAWMYGIATAGTYTIVADYTPTNENYTKLHFTFTVTVERAKPQWGVTLDDTYSGDYSFIDVSYPTVTGYDAPIEITVKASNAPDKNLFSGNPSDLTEFVKTLDVISEANSYYTVTYQVVETDNYEGLSVRTSRLYINRIVNYWIEEGDIGTSQWNAGYTWPYSRDEVNSKSISVVLPKAFMGNVKITFNDSPLSFETTEELNAHLNTLDLEEGTYTLIFTVDATNNYNDITSTCFIVISKNDNDWSKKFAGENINASGHVNTVTFQYPQANNENDLVRFDVVMISGPEKLFDGKNTSNLKKAELEGILAILVNGTYTITARLGGDELSDWTKYNKDYVAISTSCTITVSLLSNSWINGDVFSDSNWQFGNFATDVEAKMKQPNAEYGNDTIVYTVHNGDHEEIIDASSDKYKDFASKDFSSRAEYAFDDFKKYLATLTAGTYNVTISIIATNEYAAPETLTKMLTVNVADNSWSTSPNNAASETTVNWTYGDPYKGEPEKENKAIQFVPAHDIKNTIRFTVDGGASTAYTDSALASALAALNAGDHVVIVTVDADEKYGALTFTLKLVIGKASNGWVDGKDLSIGGEERGWTWDNGSKDIDTGLEMPVPLHGDSVLVTVTNVSTGNTEFQVTITYQNMVPNKNDVDVLITKLQALDVVSGGYKIIVSVNEQDNYKALEGTEQSFTIKQATNNWLEGKEPSIGGWDFGGSTAYPTATPKYGGTNNVIFRYTPTLADDSWNDDTGELDMGSKGVVEHPLASRSWSTSPDTQAGSYILWAYVVETDNYGYLEGYFVFNVNQARNEWVTMPGVVEWSWNNFNADTNLFSGSGRSQQDPVFSISHPAIGAPDEAGSPLEDKDFTESISEAVLRLLNNGFKLEKNSRDILVVPENVAQALNALKPGSYVLTVKVAAGASLTDLSGTRPFTVSMAENSWTEMPIVESFTYGENISLKGAVMYGQTVNFKITGDTLSPSGVTVVCAVNGDRTIDFTNLKNALMELNVGSYTLHAWVNADANGTYKALRSENDSYQTAFKIIYATNHWQQIPKTSVEEYWAVIQGYKDFESNEQARAKLVELLGQAEAEFGEVVYTIMYASSLSPINTTPYSYTQFLQAVVKLAPGDYVVRIVAKADNYNDLLPPEDKDMSLTINRYNTEFTTIPDQLAGKWKQNDTELYYSEIVASYYYGAVDDRTYVAIPTSEIEYVFYGETYYTFAELQKAIKMYSSGSYTVTVRVNETNTYKGVSEKLQIIIAAGDNGWVADEENGIPVPEDSFVLAGDEQKNAVHQWAWDTEIDWLGVKSLYGTTVYVRIVSAKDETDVLKYWTISTNDTSGEQRKWVSDFLNSLDVGVYYMIITTPSGSDWDAMEDDNMLTRADANSTRVMFEITQAGNAWVEEPHFVVNKASTLEWSFESSVDIVATPRHGVVTVVYYDADGTKYTTLPTNVGTYKAVFSVQETANYKAIADFELEFTIVGIVDAVFNDLPGVSGWTWNNYVSSNRFTGRARSGGAISYEIFDADGKLKVKEFLLVDINGERTGDMEKDIYAPSWVIALLNTLTEGEYTLRVHVAANGNYEYFNADTTFNVTEAANNWTTVPHASDWVQYQWNAEEYAPKATPRYGTALIVITSNATGTEFYRAESSAQGVNEIFNNLAKAEVGSYTMVVSVAGEAGMYAGLDTVEQLFRVYAQGSTNNAWVENPAIKEWTADIVNNQGIYNMPSAQPLYGKAYFEFQKILDNGQIVDIKPGCGIDYVTIEKGTTYARDFYIPTEPGTYFMLAYAEGEDGSNKLSASAIRFEIDYRQNTWQQSISIAPILYLGEYANWVLPTALPTYGLVSSYVYFDEDGNELGTEIPMTPGKYSVRAYAEADYCRTLISEAFFEIVLSVNYWEIAPTIDNWSEEYSSTSPDPQGAAMYGNENLEIWYENLDTGEKITDGSKPTAAGNYRLHARVEYFGYETLSATWDFTIEPAFDSTFLMICTVLGMIACILTVVVIIFAIKRYKEN